MALFGPVPFTVHVRNDEAASARFVADRFSLLAFLFAPLYFLTQRRWWLAVGAIILIMLVNSVLMATKLDGPVIGLVNLFIAVLIGLEAPSLVRWALARTGYQEVGVVVAANENEAERRFFEAGIPPRPVQASVPQVGRMPPMAMPTGLFPVAEPKVPR